MHVTFLTPRPLVALQEFFLHFQENFKQSELFFIEKLHFQFVNPLRKKITKFNSNIMKKILKKKLTQQLNSSMHKKRIFLQD